MWNILHKKNLAKNELVKYKAIETWDGSLPRFTGGGAIPFIDVNK